MTGLEANRERLPVFVAAGDPVSRDGVASQLRGHGIELVDERRVDPDVVAVVVVDEIDEEAEQRAIAKARAEIAANRGVPHEKVREWLLKLRDGKVEPPPCE